MIVCNLTVKNNSENFPNLYLNYRQLNFIFFLEYKALFIEVNNRIYFLVIYRDAINTIWNFGIILIKKNIKLNLKKKNLMKVLL